MKKGLLTSFALFLCNLLFCQLTYDKTLAIEGYSDYDNRCVIGYLPDYDYIIYQQDYVCSKNTLEKNKIVIYDLSYNLVKEIDIAPLGKQILLGFDNKDKKFNIGVTQYLFNQDSLIEFIVQKDNQISVYNENLDLIQKFSDSTGSSLGMEIELIVLEDDTPYYKLKVGQYKEFQFYNIDHNPFESPYASKSMPLPELEGQLFTISPDPTNEMLIVKYSKKTRSLLLITDENGRIVKQIEICGADTEIPISIHNLMGGTYFCHLTTYDNRKITERFTKF